MQVRIISLDKSPPKLMQFMRTVSEDVAMQQGIDVRNVASESLVQSQVISFSSANAIDHGRKWHHEMPSKGAVGLAIANRLALMEDTSIPLLLLEEDCVIKHPEQFRDELNLLLARIDEFDLAVFGGTLMYDVRKSTKSTISSMPSHWVPLSGTFFRTHCVLYSPKGRRKVSEYLRNNPLEMQIDSLYSEMAKMGMVRVWVQHENHSAVQQLHFSSMQDICLLCFTRPIGLLLTQSSLRTFVLYTIAGCTLAMMVRRSREKRNGVRGTRVA